jgi:hypothetical protein
MPVVGGTVGTTTLQAAPNRQARHVADMAGLLTRIEAREGFGDSVPTWGRRIIHTSTVVIRSCSGSSGWVARPFRNSGRSPISRSESRHTFRSGRDSDPCDLESRRTRRLRTIVRVSRREGLIAIASAIVVLMTACQGSAPETPSASATLSTSATTSPPPGVVLPGRLLFSRFDESIHTFQGSFISRADGSDETEVPLPFTEGLASWSRSGTEITVGTQTADGRIGTAIIAPDGTVLRVLEIPDPTLNLPCPAWSPDDARLACEGWDDTDPARLGIYSVRASDGGELQRLTTPPEGMRDIPGDFSPTGQFVFKRAAGDGEANGSLMLIDATGGEPALSPPPHTRTPGASHRTDPW